MKRIVMLSLLTGLWHGPGTAHAARPLGGTVATLEASISRLPRKAPPAAEPPLSAATTERVVSIGFLRSGRLRNAVRERLLLRGVYRLEPSPRIAGAPAALFVGGRLVNMKRVHGWVRCEARYLVASQPGPVVKVVDVATAQVPVLPGRSTEQRHEAIDIAEVGCLSDVAEQIARSASAIGG